MKKTTMDINAFLERHNLSPEAINGPGCLQKLLRQMEDGLAGRGNIPMIPSCLSPDVRPVPGVPCKMVIEGSQIKKRTGFGP